MHEVGIAASILDGVRAEATARRPARPVKVGVRIGALAGIDADALTFSFDVLVKGSDLDPLELTIEPAAEDELEFIYLELEQP